MENTVEQNVPLTRNYFVDEAGDGTLFNRRKQVVVGNEGCSSYFVLGLLDVSAPKQLNMDIANLRTNLLADSYLQSVPSMQLQSRKTAVAFHAKDDCVEVRREVFRTLMDQDLKFFALVRDKRVIVKKVRAHNSLKADYRYHPNQLYDRCVSRLFRDRLHKDSSYAIHFSMRGNKPRTKSLEASLEQARSNFRRKYGDTSSAPIEIIPSMPAESGGLQAVDYFLWGTATIVRAGRRSLLELRLRQGKSCSRRRRWSQQFVWRILFSREAVDLRKPQKKGAGNIGHTSAPHGMKPNFVPSYLTAYIDRTF